MKKRVIIVIILCLCVINLFGCDNKQKTKQKEQKQEIINDGKVLELFQNNEDEFNFKDNINYVESGFMYKSGQVDDSFIKIKDTWYLYNFGLV